MTIVRQEARKRVFARMEIEEKQADAKRTFVFPAPLPSKGVTIVRQEARKRVFARMEIEEKQAVIIVNPI